MRMQMMAFERTHWPLNGMRNRWQIIRAKTTVRYRGGSTNTQSTICSITPRPWRRRQTSFTPGSFPALPALGSHLHSGVASGNQMMTRIDEQSITRASGGTYEGLSKGYEFSSGLCKTTLNDQLDQRSETLDDILTLPPSIDFLSRFLSGGRHLSHLCKLTSTRNLDSRQDGLELSMTIPLGWLASDDLL